MLCQCLVVVSGVIGVHLHDLYSAHAGQLDILYFRLLLHSVDVHLSRFCALGYSS